MPRLSAVGISVVYGGEDVNICHTCIHRALRPIGGFALWGCLKLRIRFGNDADWKAGKNQPEECREYAK